MGAHNKKIRKAVERRQRDMRRGYAQKDMRLLHETGINLRRGDVVKYVGHWDPDVHQEKWMDCIGIVQWRKATIGRDGLERYYDQLEVKWQTRREGEFASVLCAEIV